MSNNNNGSSSSGSSSGGVTFLGLLTIAFIVLKLLKVINWSWLWVLSPIWIPVVIFIIVLLILLLIPVIGGIISSIESRRWIK